MNQRDRQRRQIIKGSVATLASGLVLPFLDISADTGTRLSVDRIQALLRVLREAPPDRFQEQFAELVRAGLDRDEALAALTEFAVQGVQPWPDVGFKYHSVMMLQSLLECCRSLEGDEVWPPLFWAADYIRRQVDRERSSSGWSMPVTMTGSGTRSSSKADLLQALDDWDREAAEAAVAYLLEEEPAGDVLQLLLPYSARDYRSIGHKVITAANAHRMISATGYVADELVRSLVIAITNPGGDSNPAKNNHRADRTWPVSREVAANLEVLNEDVDADWSAGRDILDAMRTVNDLEAVDLVAIALHDGVSDRVILEALLASAGEQMLRQGSFVAIHTNTMADALQHIYKVSVDQTSRLVILLQSASLLASIREQASRARREIALDEFEAADPGVDIQTIFEHLGESRIETVPLVLSYLDNGGDADLFVREIRRYTIERASDSHDFKYAEAVIENYRFMQGPWKNRYLASAMMSVNGPHNRRSQVVALARQALSS